MSFLTHGVRIVFRQKVRMFSLLCAWFMWKLFINSIVMCSRLEDGSADGTVYLVIVCVLHCSKLFPSWDDLWPDLWRFCPIFTPVLYEWLVVRVSKAVWFTFVGAPVMSTSSHISHLSALTLLVEREEEHLCCRNNTVPGSPWYAVSKSGKLLLSQDWRDAPLKTGLNAFFSFWHCETNYKTATNT